MGIRFYCPNGHKLHVKGFLAGKKGICPDCGAKVDIPYESTRSSSKGEGSNPRHQAPPQSPLAMPVEPRGSVEPPKVSGGGDRPLTPLHQTQPATAVAAPLGKQFGRLPHPSHPGEDVTAVPMSKPASPASGTPTIPTGRTATPVTPPAPHRADPIEEAPQAIWYVRPKTGGQYGPAAGEIFRRWLDEGRVGSDSLVWREGWSEWKLASETFDKFAAQPAAPHPPAPAGQPAESLPAMVTRPTGRTAEQQRLLARRNSANVTIMFIILLLLSVSALFATLIWILLR